MEVFFLSPLPYWRSIGRGEGGVVQMQHQIAYGVPIRDALTLNMGGRKYGLIL